MTRPHVKPLAVLLACSGIRAVALRPGAWAARTPGRAEAGRGSSGSEREATFPRSYKLTDDRARALGAS